MKCNHCDYVNENSPENPTGLDGGKGQFFQLLVNGNRVCMARFATNSVQGTTPTDVHVCPACGCIVTE